MTARQRRRNKAGSENQDPKVPSFPKIIRTEPLTDEQKIWREKTDRFMPGIVWGSIDETVEELQKSPDAMTALLDLLNYAKTKKEGEFYVDTIMRALSCASAKGVSMSAALPALIDALNDVLNDARHASYTESAILNAAKNGEDLSAAVPMIGKLLNSNLASMNKEILEHTIRNEKTREQTVIVLANILKKRSIRGPLDTDEAIAEFSNTSPIINAALILENAASERIDLSIAIPILIDALKGERFVRLRVANILLHAVENGNQETLCLITTEINAIMQSNWFMTEVEKNSPLFEELSKECASIMAAVKQKEEKDAGIETSKTG